MDLSVILLVVLTAMIAALLFLVLKTKSGESDEQWKIKFIELEQLLKNQPELFLSRSKEAQAENNEKLLKSFSELREGLIEKSAESEQKITAGLFTFRDEIFKRLEESFNQLNTKVEERLEKISNKVRENLNEGFKNTNETFQNVLLRLAKIDEAQKKIESLSTNVVSLQDVLTDKKSRGIFGEVQLHQVLSSVFGEVNEKIYKLQHMLKGGKIVDCMLFLPEPMGNICVDSKFPLENYRRIFDKELDETARLNAQKEFAKNVKKHINDIAEKYIVANETADQAIMFLPAEAIFAEIHAYHPELISYANEKRVWVAGPTTFLATLTTVQSVLTNIERNKYMGIMHQEINKLGEEFKRYQDRWDDLSKHIQTVSKDVDKIHTTTSKISSRFQKIAEVEVESFEQLE